MQDSFVGFNLELGTRRNAGSLFVLACDHSDNGLATTAVLWHQMVLVVEIAYLVARNQVLVVLDQVELPLVVDDAVLDTDDDVHEVGDAMLPQWQPSSLATILPMSLRLHTVAPTSWPFSWSKWISVAPIRC